MDASVFVSSSLCVFYTYLNLKYIWNEKHPIEIVSNVRNCRKRSK